jgi:hypothetical protein
MTPINDRRGRLPVWVKGLPPYRGGKRRLVGQIFAELATVLPPTEWPHRTVVDPFSGGGAVALQAKALGFSVVAGDLSEVAVTVARALVANSHVKVSEADLRGLYVAARSFGPAGPEPAAFTDVERNWLVGALAFADGHSEPRRSLLRLLVVHVALRLRPMSVLDAADAKYFDAGDLDRLTAKRLAHYLRTTRAMELPSLRKLAAAINCSVLAGRGNAIRSDALATIRATAADVAFLDPPYPAVSGYDRAYAPLRTLLGEETASPASTVPTLEEILETASAIPTVVLTYGGRGVTLDSLVARVGRFRRVERAVAIPFPHLPALARKEHARENREHIVVAVR